MESKSGLKDRLIYLFRRPALLLSANCGGCRSNRAAKQNKINKVLTVTGDRADQKGRTCPPTSPSSSPSILHHHHYYYFKEEEENKTTKQNKKKKKKTTKTGSPRCELFSSSAMESVDDFGFFSSNEEGEEAGKDEDIEAFLSSRSFSSDSSDFYKKAKKMKSFYRPRRREKKSRRLWVNGRRREQEEAGFAVTKKSSDPYGDFQNSMMEMIVERQIFGAGELQCLLNSYLTLNSAQNHPVILKAFVDISRVLFG
ncbi:transcription repressor OFP8-like [Phalaenopsis equestris]|uniref:transcription repressor OFP8-like n=1 Tax=Phalaenopsis equestris TaxID=78828 RepID=UPI0009E30CC1|nr:transcription repressor OFP8-like [Phalaenopsis equestris]